MTIDRVIGMTRSPFTKEESKFKWQGEAWSVDFQMPPFTRRSVAADWIAFGVKLEGMFNHFLLGDPSARIPRGVATGSPKVDGAGQQGNTLAVKDFTPSVTGILKKNDYFQIGTGALSRLHMLTEDADTDPSGDTILTFAPALRYSPADGAAIIVTDAKGVFRLTSNSWSWSVAPGPQYRLSFQATEVVDA